MNYRHAFHAGNHTEVFKHSILIHLVQHLASKPQAFMALDTHAGLGLYDLQSNEATRTGEALEGVTKIFSSAVPTSTTYLDIVRSLNPSELRLYPGSPLLIRRLLRQG